jgi:hypothetical protein
MQHTSKRMNLRSLKPLPFYAALLMITPVVSAQITPAVGVKQYLFGIVNPNNNAETDVRGINNNRVFVGDTASSTQVANSTENGYQAQGNALLQFSVPQRYGARDTDANNISNNNMILGMYDVSGDADHGFILDKKGFHKLPDPDFTKYDRFPDWNGINKQGQIIGIAFNLSTNVNDSFILDENKFTYYQGSQFSSTYGNLEFNGINDRVPASIVGEVQDRNLGNLGINVISGTHGVLFRAGQLYVFDFPGATETVAFGVNNKGDIVGSYTDPNTGNDRGFLLVGFPGNPKWFTIDNGSPTYPNTTIRCINDQREIGGKLSGGSDVGFVAVPR